MNLADQLQKGEVTALGSHTVGVGPGVNQFSRENHSAAKMRGSMPDLADEQAHMQAVALAVAAADKISNKATAAGPDQQPKVEAPKSRWSGKPGAPKTP